MSSTNEIHEYLTRLKRGEQCIDEFFNAVSGHIRVVAYRYLVDKSFVHDVVMNTFCKVLDNIQKFDELQSGKAWINKITQNEAYTINNRERKHTHAALDDLSEEIVCTTDDTQSLEFIVDLENALNKLEAIDRKIVELRVLDDRTFEEIADELDMYVGTVYKRFIRSVKMINKDIL